MLVVVTFATRMTSLWLGWKAPGPMSLGEALNVLRIWDQKRG